MQRVRARLCTRGPTIEDLSVFRLAPAALAASLIFCTLPAPAPAAAPSAPLVLPGDAAAAGAASGGWLIGAPPGARAAAVAARHGARRVTAGTFLVPRARARELAAALQARGLLSFAEPDRRAHTLQAPPAAVAPDPLSQYARWRDVVVDPALAPPPVSATSPLLALVDAQLDTSHPEFAGGNVTSLGGLPLAVAHGTQTAAIAAAPKNDIGILGIWPGMRALNVPLPSEIACSDSTAGIARAVAAGAAVINMSYGSAAPCFAEYVQLQLATARGVTLVAAAGNEFAAGNRPQYPASFPHVLTVAAIDANGKSAFFSNANAAVDLSAPGVGVVTATPPQFDGDGNGDGYEAVTGTSFSAPMVAAAAAWVRAVRPQLTVDQVAQVLRLSARDLARRGWDTATGFGLLSVGRAVVQKPPAIDALEPNDDVIWVNGRALGRPRQALWSGGRPRRVRALLDLYEDPADVYRLRFPPRSRLRVSVQQRFGDADVAAFTRSARSIDDDEQLIARSQARGNRKDTLELENPSRRSRLAYVEVYVREGTRVLDAGYELSVRRLRR